MASFDIEQYEITDANMSGHLVSELADVPALSPANLKAKFDDLVKNLVVPRFNAALGLAQQVIDTADWMQMTVKKFTASFAAGESIATVSVPGVVAGNPVFVTNNQQAGSANFVAIRSAYCSSTDHVTIVLTTGAAAAVSVPFTLLAWVGTWS